MVALSVLLMPPTASARGGHKGHSRHHGHHGGHPHGHIGSHRRHHGYVDSYYGGLGLFGYRSYPWYRSYSVGYPSSLRTYRGPAISLAAEVQIALARRGYYRGPIDGLVGSGTRRALRNFQTERHLPVTGGIDWRTLRALGLD